MRPGPNPAEAHATRPAPAPARAAGGHGGHGGPHGPGTHDPRGDAVRELEARGCPARTLRLIQDRGLDPRKVLQLAKRFGTMTTYVFLEDLFGTVNAPVQGESHARRQPDPAAGDARDV